MNNRDDVLKIRKLRRIYDRGKDRFTFHVEYETITEITPRTLDVAEAFGLGIDEAQKFLVLNTILQISPEILCWLQVIVAAARVFCYEHPRGSWL